MDLSECYGSGGSYSHDRCSSINAANFRNEITRLKASEKYLFDAQEPIFEVSVEEIKDALYFAFIISYAQGMDQLCRASEEYQYNLNM